MDVPPEDGPLSGPALDGLARRARDGDADALEALAIAAQDKVYNLAIRMLRSPADAEDATQEILVKIITRLSEFRGESAFMTWVFRVATNHLLNVSARLTRAPQAGFEELGDLLDRSLAMASPDIAEDYDEAALAVEVRRRCTLGMLLCLDRHQRIALILGELFDMPGEEAARILEISPAAYRKRLSRARTALVGFVSSRCGIANPVSPCRCARHIGNQIASGRIDPRKLRYAAPGGPASEAALLDAQRSELSALVRTSALLREHPDYRSPGALAARLREMVRNPRSALFSAD